METKILKKKVVLHKNGWKCLQVCLKMSLLDGADINCQLPDLKHEFLFAE